MSNDVSALIHNASEALYKLEIAVRYAATISMARECEEADIEWRYSRLISRLLEAAGDLGYTLTPIVTPSPDSGRAKEIGDVFQNHGA